MVFVCADVHGDVKRWARLLLRMESYAGRKLGLGDVIIVAGDLFDVDKTSLSAAEVFCEFRMCALSKAIQSSAFSVFFTDGNRDMIPDSTLFHVEEQFGGACTRVARNIWYAHDGTVYHMEGSADGSEISVMFFGGAIGHNGSGYQWKTESEWIERWTSGCGRIFRYKSVDYVVTHDCPTSQRRLLALVFPETSSEAGLNIIEHDIVFHRRWFFGHHHVDYDTSDGFSCIYNRCMAL